MITTVTEQNPKTCGACSRPLITQEMFDKRGDEIEAQTGKPATIGDVTADLPTVFPNHCDVRDPNGAGCRYWKQRALTAEKTADELRTVISADTVWRSAQTDLFTQNSARYERLRILGVWINGPENRSLLCFQNLDEFVDADIKLMPSRGEAKIDYPSKTEHPMRDLVYAEPVVGPNGRWIITLGCGHKVYSAQKKSTYMCLECRPEQILPILR